MNLSELRVLLVKADVDWDLRWTRDQIIGLLRGNGETSHANLESVDMAELGPGTPKQSKRKYRLELLCDFTRLTFLHASVCNDIICTREQPWGDVSLDGSEMLRIDLGAPSGFMTLPVSVLMGKVFPKRRMTYWDRSSGFVAGTIELGFSCKQYEETVTGPGAMALQLAAAVPNQGSMKLEEAEEVTQEIQSPYLKELIIEIAALEDLNNQLRSKIAVLINESDVGHELGRTKQAS